MGDQSIREQFADVLTEVEKRNWAIPAAQVGGDLVPIAWFSAWSLADAVEDWLQANRPDLVTV